MVETVQILVLLLAVVAAVAVVAARLEIPPAILLVIAGVILGHLGLPSVELAPELVLLLVLPPVIDSAAVSMSWNEFRFNLRPISLLAVGCVVFTTVAVAAATHWLLGLPWPVGFVLGAIVSPPDAVAPLSILRRMQLPRAYPGRARRGAFTHLANARARWRSTSVRHRQPTLARTISANGTVVWLSRRRRAATACRCCCGHWPT